MENTETIQRLLISALPILIAITFHEVAHGYVALRLGDPTAKLLGRLTLNPLAHIDIFGTILLPLIMYATTGFAFGYAKPVPINPMNFRNPRKGMALSAVSGPATNIALALLSGIILKFLLIPLSEISPTLIGEAILYPMQKMLAVSVLINFMLAALNMIPIPPLDGGRVLAGLLPSKLSFSFSKIEPFGFIIVLILFYTHVTDYILWPFILLFIKLFNLEFIFALLRSN